ncbi:DUF6003 family protein [Streptomyces sp. NPDC005574]|uniref:DUF6003 family protein n=1 Tax=Streptomyces sp. NPDC005574 TaxID=3156891 RepID=UPI0033A917DF
MTDDAYLFLLDDTRVSLGLPPTAVGGLSCMDTPAVRAWLEAQGATATSPQLRLLPPEETGAIPEHAERLPVPLSEEELNVLRRQTASGNVARAEEELVAYRDSTGDRDALIGRALAAGVPPHRVVELTGVDPATVTAAAAG